LENFQDFLEATEIARVHNDPEVAGRVFGACKKSKNLLKLIGGPEVKTLYTHVGKIMDTDSWEETTGKISRGLRGQTNQASARFKLMQKLPQGDSSFSEWFPKMRDQAGQCTWEGYNVDGAARDAILLQTKDKQLHKRF